jgi:hypothetical protein
LPTRWTAEDFLDLHFSSRVFSSLGMRTPTPWVRPAEAVGRRDPGDLAGHGIALRIVGSDSNR